MSLDIMSYFGGAQREQTARLGGSMPVSAPSYRRMSILPKNLDILPPESLYNNDHFYYFTLALPQTRFYNRGYDHEIKKYYIDKFNELYNNIQDITLYLSLEYCSDGVNIHAHGVCVQWTRKSFLKLKQNLRRVFEILPNNRVAIKWYQNNSLTKTGKDKLEYHLLGIDYNKNQKDIVDEFIYHMEC